MSLIDHAINILGGNILSKKPSVGITVTRIRWDGCMANVRVVEDVGDLVRYENHGKYEGIIVNYDKDGERWEPLDYVRNVNGETEVWH